MTYEPKERQILDEVTAVLHKHYRERLSRVVLFGSRARREHQPDSDYDILVVLHGELDARAERKSLTGLMIPIDLANDAVIFCHAVPEKRFIAEKSALMMNVRAEGVLL